MQAPKINQQITLQVPFGPFRGTYATRVEEIDARGIRVAMPIADREYVILAPGTEVTVGFYVDGGAYRFNTETIGVVNQDVPQIVLAPPPKVDRIQRRGYVRIDVDLPTRLAILPDGADEMPPEAQRQATVNLTARTKDLSAGGALLVTEVALCPESILEATLDLPRDEAPLELRAKVLRTVRTIPMGDHDEHWVAVQWADTSECDRSRVTRFIFEEQIRRRRKGLI